MKALRILPALIGMCLAFTAHAQEPDSSEIYYSYELIETDLMLGDDTVYQAFLIIDMLDLSRFKKLIILNESQEKVVTIKSKDLDNDPAITTLGGSYRIAIDHWSDVENLMVIGEKEDKSKKYLKKQKKEKKHLVINTPIPVNMSLRSDTALVNLNEL